MTRRYTVTFTILLKSNSSQLKPTALKPKVTIIATMPYSL